MTSIQNEFEDVKTVKIYIKHSTFDSNFKSQSQSPFTLRK